jgi:hypothetical protein
MRNARISLFACLALVSAGLATAARAEDVPDKGAFVQRLFAVKSFDQKKTFACFARRYDAAHLAQHPRQKVTAMKLLLVVEKVPAEDGSLNYSFRVGTSLRNKRDTFQTPGDCGHAQATADKDGQLQIECGVECDGGGITLSLAEADKAVMLRLSQIAMWNMKKPNAEPLTLQAGTDDGVFRLDRVDAEQCASLVPDKDELAELRRK